VLRNILKKPPQNPLQKRRLKAPASIAIHFVKVKGSF
jgi:hypothetical protein